jgi:Tol biopolymer transport system component
MNALLSILFSLFLAIAVNAQAQESVGQLIILHPGEEHFLSDINKISPKGEFSKGILSFDSELLCLQGSIPEQNIFDQVWIMFTNNQIPQMLSSGMGYASDPVFFKQQNRIIFSSTEGFDPIIPGPMPMLPDQLWQLRDFDLYSITMDGSDKMRLTETPGYDSEAAISPDGTTIVFSSFRKGDIDIYSMNIKSGEVKRLTTNYGLDCHPCFSPDGKWIVFSSFIPETDEQKATYSRMLETRQVNMANFEIYIMRSDGSERRQLTDFGAVSINPCMHPSADQIVFSSNHNSIMETGNVNSFNFELFVTNLKGTLVKQVTYNPEFDGYPSFDKAGYKILWTSSRNTEVIGQRSIYSANWKTYDLGKSTED